MDPLRTIIESIGQKSEFRFGSDQCHWHSPQRGGRGDENLCRSHPPPNSRFDNTSSLVLEREAWELYGFRWAWGPNKGGRE